MKRLATALLAVLCTIAFAAQAQADPSEYGIESASAVAASTQAGAHADFTLDLRLKKDPQNKLPSTTKDLFFAAPVGLLANPGAVPTCSAAQLLGTDVNDPSNATGCPQASQVGITEVRLVGNDGNQLLVFEPVFNMEPRDGEPARFGFIANVLPVYIDTKLRSDGDYGVTAMVEGASAFNPILTAKTTFWGIPADESHDDERITAHEAITPPLGVPHTPSGKRSIGLVTIPYMVNPTRCGVPQGVAITAIPYQLPEMRAEAFAPMTPNTGCGLLDFEPAMSVRPTTDQAETSTGLDVELSFPTDGLEHPNLLAEATQRRAEVTLPEGVTINPSQAAGGLGVCSEADLARETPTSGPDIGCPETSKIGTITAESPLVDEAAEGSLFLAKPYENPFDSLLAVYFVVKIPGRGVIVTLPAKVEPDPRTGQLVTIVDDIPQLPVSSFKLHFREGARSPLVTPPSCGTHESTAKFTSWADPQHPVTLHPSFAIGRGVNGGPCPAGSPPFGPGFSAGSLSDTAGAFTPFHMRLTRNDGDQDLTKFSATLPPGMVAKLAGVSQCSDAAIESARAKSGKTEQASPSCPASSKIGHVLGGAGVGSVLTYAEGRIYLAGPYQGAPLSVTAIVPAVAGPFDVGTVVTRVGLRLDPRTGVVAADGERSDPLPHILAGIPLKVRDIRVDVDRPNFTLNPTSCDPFQTTAELWGGGNDVFSSADDLPASRAARFQAANCALLSFEPKLSMKLKGGSKRGGHPALTGIYRPRPGDSNLEDLVLRLPRSAFLDQSHIRTICTRVQFASDTCPEGAVYGRATAVTPLLEQPLTGPVYLRSSDHKLPDLVADLHGIVDVEAVARIDSKDGGIRAIFSNIPDAALTKVVVQMQGGKKGLIVNSTNLCRGTHRADTRLEAHNAKRRVLRPEMKAECGGKQRKQQRRHG